MIAQVRVGVARFFEKGWGGVRITFRGRLGRYGQDEKGSGACTSKVRHAPFFIAAIRSLKNSYL